MLLLGLAGFFNDFVMPACWAGCMDIGGRHSGTVSGTMNMVGNIGGALSPMLVGYMRDRTGSYNTGFFVLVTIALVGAAAIALLPRATRVREAPSVL